MSPGELVNIIERCRQNDRLAQEKIYKSFFGLFYTIAKDYVQDQEEILGIVNESFLKIFLNIERYDQQKSPFEVWSKRIVNNTCIDAYRRLKRQPSIVDISSDVHVGEFAYQQRHSFDGAEIEQLLKKLPEVTGKVCMLYMVDGYSHKEIGSMLGITESTSRWHLREGRIKLKKWLETKHE